MPASRTVQHSIGGYRAFDLPRDLRRVATSLWLHSAPPAPATAQAGDWVVPDPGLSLCFTCRRAGDGGADAGRLLLLGPVRSPRAYRPEAGTRMAGIHLKPEWARPLLEVDPRDHTDGIDDYSDVRRRLGSRLLSELERTGSDDETLTVLVAFARERMAEGRPDGAAVVAHRGLEAIRRLPAPGHLEALAAEVGVTGRHLRRLVGEVVGLTPRRYAQLQRFVNLVCDADRYEHPDWVDLAAVHGYADQPHLVRAVRELGRLTPRRLHQRRRARAAAGRG